MYKVIRPINNNEFIGYDEYENEVIVVSKGIGFNLKPNTKIDISQYKNVKIFFSDDQRRFGKKLDEKDRKFISKLNSILYEAESDYNTVFSQNFYDAILDHVLFAVVRSKENMTFENPFSEEIKTIYEKEYLYAEKVVNAMNEVYETNANLSEAALIAIHIRSAVDTKDLNKEREKISFINDAINKIEKSMNIFFDKKAFSYKRLVIHLSYAYERINLNLQIDEDITDYIKSKYLDLFNEMRKIVDKLQDEYNIKISDGEVSYLVMHIGRYVKEAI